MLPSSKIKELVLAGAAAAALMAAAPPAQATTTIYVAVAANFANPLNDIIGKFKTYALSTYGYDYDVTYTSGASGNLLSQITGSCATTPTCATTNPNAWGHYDLFLSADVSRPLTLYSTYPSLVSTWTTGASPASANYLFEYAQGYLELYTNTGAWNVSSGLPSGWTTKGVGIAAPGSAPYGLAATQELWNAYTVTSTSALVHSTYADIASIYNAVVAGTETFGYVAKSQICSAGAVNVPSTRHQSISPSSTTYNAIIQDGVIIANTTARTRTAGEETELRLFVAYLNNHTTSPPSDTVTTLLNYCYGVP
ncbi:MULTISPECIES: substrate-binding domain-containing protein [Methylosinus]|nr:MULTISPECIES: substrate-binding domain-containing protein [Methylosinus]